jgi:hypothetical protein
MGSHRIQFGKDFGDLACESRVQALGLVNSDEFLEFAGGIRLNARPLRFEQRTVHLLLGPHLAEAGPRRRGFAGQMTTAPANSKVLVDAPALIKPFAMPAAEVMPWLTSRIDARA